MSLFYRYLELVHPIWHRTHFNTRCLCFTGIWSWLIPSGTELSLTPDGCILVLALTGPMEWYLMERTLFLYQRYGKFTSVSRVTFLKALFTKTRDSRFHGRSTASTGTIPTERKNPLSCEWEKTCWRQNASLVFMNSSVKDYLIWWSCLSAFKWIQSSSKWFKVLASIYIL